MKTEEQDMKTTQRRAGLVLGAVLLGLGGAAQAALMAYTSDGEDLVLDGQGLTWTADANLFRTQYLADNDVVNKITTAVPTITHLGGTRNIVAADFNTTSGQMKWFGAMAWAEWLGIIGYGGADDWRLWEADPSCGVAFYCTGSELGHLYYTEGVLSQGSLITSSPTLNADAFPTTGVFTNLQNSFYWSGTQYAPSPDGAWGFGTGNGPQDVGNKVSHLYGWAVRSGQVPVPLPATGFLMALGLMALGAGRQGRRATLVLR
jgi:hypothetical protein